VVLGRFKRTILQAIYYKKKKTIMKLLSILPEYMLSVACAEFTSRDVIYCNETDNITQSHRHKHPLVRLSASKRAIGYSEII